MNGNTDVAIFWTVVIMAFSFVVILFINLWSRRTTSYREGMERNGPCHPERSAQREPPCHPERSAQRGVEDPALRKPSVFGKELPK